MSGTTLAPVSINTAPYPDSNRTHGTFAIINNTLANTEQIPQRALIIAQPTNAAVSAGLVAGTPVISNGLGIGNAAYGLGSILAKMVDQYRGQDTFGEMWVLPIADAGGAAKATGTLAITGTATVNGTLYVYVGQDEYFVPVNSGDTAATVIADAVTTINSDPLCLAVASVGSGGQAGDVVLTFKNGGTIGNAVFLGINQQGGEVTPSGLTVVVSTFAGGATDPQIASALANLGDKTFDYIATSFSDTTNLNALQSFLNDQTGRWSWEQQLYGHAFYGIQGSMGTLVAFGNGRNNQHETLIGSQGSRTPFFQWAADLCGASAVSLRANPAMPLQELQLNVVAPSVLNRFDISERNSLLYDGVSTWTANDAGQVITDRIITTYQTNTAGAPDNSYLDVETMATLTAGIRDMRAYLQSQFARKVLVADGSLIPGGSALVTSKTVLASAISRYRYQCLTLCWMQNPDQFAQQALSQNAGNGEVKLYLPFMLANQLRQIAMQIQFTKP